MVNWKKIDTIRTTDDIREILKGRNKKAKYPITLKYL